MNKEWLDKKDDGLTLKRLLTVAKEVAVEAFKKHPFKTRIEIKTFSCSYCGMVLATPAEVEQAVDDIRRIMAEHDMNCPKNPLTQQLKEMTRDRDFYKTRAVALEEWLHRKDGIIKAKLSMYESFGLWLEDLFNILANGRPNP